MKIAISGKGGVGKSTVAAALALTLANRGERVLALDADPDANLAAAMGMPEAETPTPISRQIALIEERTGVKIDSYGQVFKLNPEVSDVAERFAVNWRGVDMLTLGAVPKGGGGCACPASAFIKSLITDLVLYKKQTLIMDMEAGVEHLGRATAGGVGVMLVVVEPGQRSVDCAKTVMRMCEEIGVKRVLYIGNKIAAQSDEDYLHTALKNISQDGETADGRLIAAIPYTEALRSADRPGVSVMDTADSVFIDKINTIIDIIYR